MVYAVLLLGFVGASATASAQSFDWFFNMQTGFRTSGVAAGDFDRDGDLDLAFAVGEHWPSPTLIFFNDGRGNFTERQRIGGRDQKGHAIGAVDLNGDGALDLVLVTEIGDRNKLLLNDGTGHFIEAWRFGPVGDNGRDVAVADLDRDGLLDVVVVNRGQPNRAFRNRGSEGLEQWFDFGATASATVAVGIADLDRDGWPDLVSADWAGPTRGIHVWRNDGTGRLLHHGTYGRAQEAVFAIDLGDLDGDGDVDIAAAVAQRGSGAGNPGADHILWNDGGGRFPDRIDFGRGNAATIAVELADLNQDGRLDIAVGHRRGEGFYSYEGPGREFWFDRLTPGYYGSTFLNLGNRAFREASPFSVHAGAPHEILAADVNGDRYLDLVVASGSGISAAFLNSLGPEVGRWRPQSP